MVQDLRTLPDRIIGGCVFSVAIILAWVQPAEAVSYSLSPTDIRAAIEEAASEYLGDFPRDSTVAISHRYRFVFDSYRKESEVDLLAETRLLLSLAVPRPPESEMLARPRSFIELFVAP